MATKIVTREENVDLKDLRIQLSLVLANKLCCRETSWYVEKGATGACLDIYLFVELVKEKLGLESVHPAEVLAGVKDILENSKIKARIGGANNSLLIIEIIFPEPEPEGLSVQSLPDSHNPAEVRASDFNDESGVSS